jgi:hypothetical protein
MGEVYDIGSNDDDLSLSASVTGDEESDVAFSTKEQVEKEMQSSIVTREERVIYFFRILILIAIICSALAVSIAVYLFAMASDNALFEAEVSNWHETTGSCNFSTFTLCDI